MNAIDSIKAFLGQLNWYAGLGKACISDAGRFDECEGFWAVIGIAVGIVGIVTLAFIARHFLRERAAYLRAWKKKQAELAIADSETMAKAMWKGEGAFGAELSKDEIIRRIKAAKAQKRLEVGSSAGEAPKGDKSLGIDVLHR